MAISNVLGIFNCHKQRWAGQTEDFYSKHWTERGCSQVMWLHIKLYDKGTVPFLLVGTPHTLF